MPDCLQCPSCNIFHTAAKYQDHKKQFRRVRRKRAKKHQNQHPSRTIDGKPWSIEHSSVYHSMIKNQMVSTFPTPSDKTKYEKQYKQRMQRIFHLYRLFHPFRFPTSACFFHMNLPFYRYFLSIGYPILFNSTETKAKDFLKKIFRFLSYKLI